MKSVHSTFKLIIWWVEVVSMYLIDIIQRYIMNYREEWKNCIFLYFLPSRELNTYYVQSTMLSQEDRILRVWPYYLSLLGEEGEDIKYSQKLKYNYQLW